MGRRAQQRGSAMVEFVFAGIGSVMVLICTFQLAMGMWHYHTLATMVHDATRYASVRGVSCTKPGNTCSVTVGNIARKIESTGIGSQAIGSMSNSKLKAARRSRALR